MLLASKILVKNTRNANAGLCYLWKILSWQKSKPPDKNTHTKQFVLKKCKSAVKKTLLHIIPTSLLLPFIFFAKPTDRFSSVLVYRQMAPCPTTETQLDQSERGQQEQPVIFEEKPIALKENLTTSFHIRKRLLNTPNCQVPNCLSCQC